ncbi:MAG TPA: hypothetical protein VH186_17295 [Chloroflexia bacterium]|nr:hypothetical protein [Chloroflexia bacterium]
MSQEMKKDSPATTPEDELKRESGLPGGGQGRKDEIGHTGIYPLSGPEAPDDAELVTMAEFGQGERGPEGYYDHGESGVTYGAAAHAEPALPVEKAAPPAMKPALPAGHTSQEK